MVSEIARRGRRLGIGAFGLMLNHISAQDGFAQAARAAMDQDHQLLFAQAQPPEGRCVQDGLDLLQFSEVIAAADRPQRFANLRGFELCCGEDLANVAFPRMLQIEAKVSPEAELEVALHEVRLEQGHAATDVAADEVGINDPLGDKGSAHWASPARVQVRETDRQTHGFESCRCVELVNRFALDPAIGRGEEAHGRGGWIDGLVD